MFLDATCTAKSSDDNHESVIDSHIIVSMHAAHVKYSPQDHLRLAFGFTLRMAQVCAVGGASAGHEGSLPSSEPHQSLDDSLSGWQNERLESKVCSSMHILNLWLKIVMK